jgi:hypothetical protein
MFSMEAVLPPPGRCVVCGKPLGVDPHLITAIPDGEHLHCRDWSRTAWPYERVQKQLRARYLALRRASQTIEALGRWLNERQRKWPDLAPDTVQQVTRRIDELRRALDRAGVRWSSWR